MPDPKMSIRGTTFNKTLPQKKASLNSERKYIICTKIREKKVENILNSLNE